MRVGLVAAGACLAAAAWAVTAAGAAVPNPCTVVASGTVATTMGLKGVTLSGKLTTRPDGRVKQSVCTYTVGKNTIQIDLAPHQQSGGSGGPPGMVLLKLTGLGPGATYAYDTNPKFEFASVSFTKGAIDAGIYENGSLPRADVPALARILYKALP